jgi:hypothetical protein
MYLVLFGKITVIIAIVYINSMRILCRACLCICFKMELYGNLVQFSFLSFFGAGMCLLKCLIEFKLVHSIFFFF